MLFNAGVVVAALGVIGDLLSAQRTMIQRTHERVRRIELQLGVEPSHYESLNKKAAVSPASVVAPKESPANVAAAIPSSASVAAPNASATFAAPNTAPASHAGAAGEPEPESALPLAAGAAEEAPL